MINNILKKIEKANEVQNVELAKHEVELNVFNELKASRAEVETRVQSSIEEIKAFEIKFKDLKKKMDVNAAYVEKIYTENRKKFQDASDKAKALGLELPKQWFDELELLRKASNKIPQSNLVNVFSI